MLKPDTELMRSSCNERKQSKRNRYALEEEEQLVMPQNSYYFPGLNAGNLRPTYPPFNQYGYYYYPYYSNPEFINTRCHKPPRTSVNVPESAVKGLEATTDASAATNFKESMAASPKSKCRKKNPSASSIFKGVSWHKRDKVYMARVGLEDGKSKHIGSYRSELRAAIAVDESLEERRKDTSYYNFGSDIERKLAMVVVKHFEKEETKTSFQSDKNNVPNALEEVFRSISKSLKEKSEMEEKTQ